MLYFAHIYNFSRNNKTKQKLPKINFYCVCQIFIYKINILKKTNIGFYFSSNAPLVIDLERSILFLSMAFVEFEFFFFIIKGKILNWIEKFSFCYRYSHFCYFIFVLYWFNWIYLHINFFSFRFFFQNILI